MNDIECRDCKSKETVEMICGAETNFDFVPLCETCQEKRYRKHYNIEPPESPEDDEF